MWTEQAQVIIDDMKQADEYYQPTHFWQHGVNGLQKDIEKYGVENFRRFHSTLAFFVPTYLFHGWVLQPERYHTMLELCQNTLEGDNKAIMSMHEYLSGKLQAKSDFRVYKASDKNRRPFTENFSESQVGSPIEQFEFDGRKYSRSSLNYLLGLNFLKQQIKDVPINTVLEIGGGFGSLGEILLSDKRNKTFYLNVDIAPTCLFSTYYLQSNFGKENIADYQTIKSIASPSLTKLSNDYQGAVICPWQLSEITGKLDLFINFISFQEMEPDIVANYLLHVARLKCKYVLLRNLKEGKQLATDGSHAGVKKPIKSDDYDLFLPSYDLVATNVNPFGFETIDGFNSELRLYKLKD